MTGPAETADLWHDLVALEPGTRWPASDRAAETVAQWLWEHPGVQVITRIGQPPMPKAPPRRVTATQVADRFHLLQTWRRCSPGLHHTHRPSTLSMRHCASKRSCSPTAQGASQCPRATPEPCSSGRRSAPRRQALYDGRVTLHRAAGRCPLLPGRWARAAHDLSLSAYADVSRQQHRSTYGRSLLTPRKPICSPAEMRGAGPDAAVSGTPTARLHRGYALVAAYTSRYARHRAVNRAPEPGADAARVAGAARRP